eukprot:8700238-Alexandrium_andersonii.AAC.1
MVLAATYRRWAAMRLADLAPWIGSWSCEELFAGAGSLGAQDGWHGSATEAEWRALNNAATATFKMD